jgi:hypothetical protein
MQDRHGNKWSNIKLEPGASASEKGYESENMTWTGEQEGGFFSAYVQGTGGSIARTASLVYGGAKHNATYWGGAIWCDLVRSGAIWCALLFLLVQFEATWLASQVEPPFASWVLHFPRLVWRLKVADMRVLV